MLAEEREKPNMKEFDRQAGREHLELSEAEDVGDFADDSLVQDGAGGRPALVVDEVEIVCRSVEQVEPQIAADFLGIAVVLDEGIEEVRCVERISNTRSNQIRREISA